MIYDAARYSEAPELQIWVCLPWSLGVLCYLFFGKPKGKPSNLPQQSEASPKRAGVTINPPGVGRQVLVHVSTNQDSIVGTLFLSPRQKRQFPEN